MAVQGTLALVPSAQPVGAVHEMVGGARSTSMPVIGPAVVQLPTTSQTWRVPVEASASTSPCAVLTVVLRVKEPSSLGSARPLPASVAVQATDTF